MLRRLKVSDAAAKTATSVRPAAQRALEAGEVRHERRVPRARRGASMPAHTASASAICGTRFGLTNADTSIDRQSRVAERVDERDLGRPSDTAAGFVLQPVARADFVHGDGAASEAMSTRLMPTRAAAGPAARVRPRGSGWLGRRRRAARGSAVPSSSLRARSGRRRLHRVAGLDGDAHDRRRHRRRERVVIARLARAIAGAVRDGERKDFAVNASPTRHRRATAAAPVERSAARPVDADVRSPSRVTRRRTAHRRRAATRAPDDLGGPVEMRRWTDAVASASALPGHRADQVPRIARRASPSAAIIAAGSASRDDANAAIAAAACDRSRATAGAASSARRRFDESRVRARRRGTSGRVEQAQQETRCCDAGRGSRTTRAPPIMRASASLARRRRAR